MVLNEGDITNKQLVSLSEKVAPCHVVDWRVLLRIPEGEPDLGRFVLHLSYCRDDVIIPGGKGYECLVVVCSGSCREEVWSTSGPNGGFLSVRTYNTNDVFGFTGFFFNEHAGRLIANEACEILMISYRHLQNLAAADINAASLAFYNVSRMLSEFVLETACREDSIGPPRSNIKVE
jgi:CRP-like cAMP-binding protein